MPTLALKRSRLALLALLTYAAAGVADAQPTRTLSGATERYEEPFTAVSGVRELRDGRVLVSDARDRTLQVIDFATGDAVAAGREGAGPGEFAVPSRLHPMPGDSTLMSDFGNGRYLILLPDGRPGPTFRVPETSPAFFGTLVGVDAAGRLILQRTISTGDGPLARGSGVVQLLRFNRTTQRTDTLATLAAPVGEYTSARALPGGMLQMSTNVPLAARDVAVASPSGGVIVVRAAPYRVDRIGADGRVASGPPATPPQIKVDQAEREAFVKSQVRAGGIVVRGGAAAAARSSTRGGAGAATVTGDISALMTPDMVWPDVKPPFASGAAWGAPDGSVWVLRSRAHSDPIPAYDVFNPAGQLRERIALPRGASLVGFGEESVYIVTRDADDLQYLQRVKLR